MVDVCHSPIQTPNKKKHLAENGYVGVGAKEKADSIH